jgi:hypothetical protein
MNTSANNHNALAKALAVVLILSVVVILITTSQLTWSSAAMQERVLENKTRKEVPIRLKIKKEKEKSFKDFKNEKWVREFELELTNTGEKPIYYVFLDLKPVALLWKAWTKKHAAFMNLKGYKATPGILRWFPDVLCNRLRRRKHRLCSLLPESAFSGRLDLRLFREYCKNAWQTLRA